MRYGGRVSTDRTAPLRERLERHPRARLAHLPTPLERMHRLEAALDGPPLFVKRDDCTGLATGGNKARKLEYLLGEARAGGATHVVSFGALQSNHARQTAAAAAALGLGCDLFLVRRVDWSEAAYTVSGNLLLDDLLGARMHLVDDEAAAAAALRDRLTELESAGQRVFVIPTGGSNEIGALGYVGCALELVEQAADLGIEIGSVVHATSSGGTQAGLIVGLAALGSPSEVIGVNVYARDVGAQESELRALARSTAAHLGVDPPTEDRFTIDPNHLGPDYGIPTAATFEALDLVARCEGLLLDPVYSGKAMGGLIARIRRGELPRERPVVFVHTGGAAALFAYQRAIAERPTREQSAPDGRPAV